MALTVFATGVLSGSLDSRAIAQTAANTGPLLMQPRYSQLKFNRSLNIYEWFYRLNYHKRVGNKLQFFLRENYRTTLQQIAVKDLWKDDQNLVVRFTYPFTTKLAFEASFDSRVLSDPLAGFDNNVTYYSGTTKLHYTPFRNIKLSPQISRQWQTQLARSDQGVGYGLAADVDRFDFNGYSTNLTFFGESDIFPTRKNDDIKFRYMIRRQFYDSTADTLAIIFDRLRRDSFDAFPTGVFIRNLIQSRKGIENKLSYKVGSSSVLYVKNALLSTSFKVNNIKSSSPDLQKEDAGFESRHSLNLKMKKSKWVGNVGWNFRLRTRDDKRKLDRTPDPFGRFPTVGFDSEDKLVELNTHSGYALSSADSLGFFAAVSKFQYDTSDTTNPNDHDFVRWQVSFSHAHTFNKTLHLIWTGGAFLNHFVFISGRFSSGNNWERIFQLTPEVVFQPQRQWYFKQKFIVRAKYQTYDFDDAETSNRNIVNRQFIVSNISHFPFPGNMSAELSVDLELAEQGRLFYSRWRQNLALSWRNREIRFMLKKRLHSGMNISVGGSYFNQKRWQHNLNSKGDLDKKLQTMHTNWGPIVQVMYQPHPSMEVLFLGNIQFVNSFRRRTETINNFDVNVNWFF